MAEIPESNEENLQATKLSGGKTTFLISCFCFIFNEIHQSRVWKYLALSN